MKAWIARDKDGRLFMYHHLRKPYKGSSMWLNTCLLELIEQDLPEGINPQWSDDEPIEVELKIERIK